MPKAPAIVVVLILGIFQQGAFSRAAAIGSPPMAGRSVTSFHSGFFVPANSHPLVNADVVLSRVLAADKRRLGAGEAGPMHVTYTMRVLSYFGPYQLSQKIRVTGVNAPLAIFRVPASPDYWIPNIPVGAYWVTLIQPAARKGVYDYRYGLLPIGFIAPVVVPADDEKPIAMALGDMRRYWKPAGVAADQNVGMRLLQSRNYFKWALGCSILAALGGKKNAHLLLANKFAANDYVSTGNGKMTTVPVLGPGFDGHRFVIRRYAWLVFTLTQRFPRKDISADDRRWINQTIAAFLYNNSGTLTGLNLIPPSPWQVVPLAHEFNRAQGVLGRRLDVASLKFVSTPPGHSPVGVAGGNANAAQQPPWPLASIGGMLISAAAGGAFVAMIFWYIGRHRRL